MIDLAFFQIVGAALFCIGVYGVLARRSAVLVLMSIELMLNAVNLNLIATAAFLDPSRFTGLMIAIFVITVAACEAAVGLAILIALNRDRTMVNVDEVNLLKW